MTVIINGTTGIVTPDIAVDGTTLTVDAVNDRVGIGNSSPSAKLHVQVASGEAIRAAASGANQHVWARFIAGSPSNTDLRIGADSASGGVYGVGGGAVVWNAGNGPLAFGTNNAERLRITSAGSVGIGTETPRSIANFGSLGINGVSGAFTDYFLNGTRTGTTAVDSNGFTCEAVGSSTPFRVITNGTEKLRITSTGLVNIGTNNQLSGDSSNKLRVGTASGSDVGVVVFGNADTTTPALIITNWDGAQTQNKSVIHFDNSGWGTFQIGCAAGEDAFGIFDDSVEKLRITSGGKIEIKGGDQSFYNASTVDGAGNHIFFTTDGGSTETTKAAIVGQNDGATTRAGRLLLNTSDSSGNLIERLRINSSGLITQGGKTASSHGSPNLLLWGSDTTLNISSTTSTNNSSNVGIKFAVAGGSTGDYSKAGIFAKRMSTYTDLDLLFCFNTAADATGTSTSGEMARIRNNGKLYLGPYKSAGQYGTVSQNIPYKIGVSPYGWANGGDVAEISMGSHVGTGQDDGQIVFKTATNVHSDATGLVERLRIDENGDSTFYGNVLIDSRDVYYKNEYATGSWSSGNWYTVVPHGLTANCTYLVALVWDWNGSNGQPYYLATQQLYSTANGTNGTGSENEVTPMVSTHTGSTGARINCRVIAQASGTPAMQVNLAFTTTGNSWIRVKVWKMLFANRSA